MLNKDAHELSFIFRACYSILSHKISIVMSVFSSSSNAAPAFTLKLIVYSHPCL